MTLMYCCFHTLIAGAELHLRGPKEDAGAIIAVIFEDACSLVYY
jgi:hypothetical protein